VELPISKYFITGEHVVAVNIHMKRHILNLLLHLAFRELCQETKCFQQNIFLPFGNYLQISYFRQRYVSARNLESSAE
jgi:hypothetical protein